jgi:vancomycin permeability regulator SanA
MQITKDNVAQFKPGELADIFNENKGVIIAGTFEIFKEIFTAIHEAIQAGGHFRKDVRSFINLQLQWNKAAEQEIARLKALVPAE